MDKHTAVKLYVVLSKAYRAAADADKKAITGYGLSPTEFAVLELLYHKGPQPIQQIAAGVLLTSGSMTYVITQLEKKGLVTRKPYEQDRRIFHAALTDGGMQLIADIYPGHEEFLYRMMDVFPEDEANELIRQLKVLGMTIQEHTN